MTIRACKGCIYFGKYYGNRNKKGERTVSNFWCVSKNGFIRSFPKQCNFRKEQSTVDNGACSADETSEKVQGGE